jgi:hypothetical protein
MARESRFILIKHFITDVVPEYDCIIGLRRSGPVELARDEQGNSQPFCESK